MFHIGFVLDSLVVAEWQAELLRAAADLPGVRCSRFVAGGERAAPPRSKPAMVALVDFVDRLLDRGKNTRLRPVELDGAEALDALPIAERSIDLIIDLRSGRPDPAWAARARHGLWTVSFGGDPDRRSLPHLWEAWQRGTHVTGVIESLRSDGRRHVLARATCAVHPYSLIRTRCVVATSTAHRLIGVLRTLIATGAARTRGAAEPAAERRPDPPGLFRLIGIALAMAGCFVRNAWDRALRDEFFWSVAIAPRREPDLATTLRDGDFHELPQPAGRFHADPFVFDRNGKTMLFTEAFPYAAGRGIIEAASLNEDGSWSTPEVVLERPYHLSYPQVFEWRGQIFMLPETTAGRTIELYRCDRFPDRWALDTVLFENVLAADATILEDQGRLWMFVTLGLDGLWLDTELHLFHAEDLRGPWRAHPLNPVISDVRSARPAGPIWKEGGHWIRPAQDCSPGYAAAISFQRITVLSTEDYDEEPCARVAAHELRWKPGARRTHHWCMGRSFVAIDHTTPRWRRLFSARGGSPHPKA